MTTTALPPAERETILTVDDATGVVRIWTAQRPVINRLRNKAGAGALEMISHGHHGTTEWAEFRLDTRAPGASFDLSRAFRVKRELSAEQKAALSARLNGANGPSAA